MAQAGPSQAPHPGEGLGRLTSSLLGETSLSSLPGASGSQRFLHACRQVSEECFGFCSCLLTVQSTFSACLWGDFNN